MELPQLREAWRVAFRSIPPARLGRSLLQLALAYRLQETVFGKLSPAMVRRLKATPHAGAVPAEAGAGPEGATAGRTRARRPSIGQLKPGSTLLRDWNGREHSVRVLEDGFDYQGQHYRSLSQIARTITGAHWSGPRFFALR